MSLALVDVDADHEGFPALRGLSLTVEPGEIVALVGPHGAGKSTVLRVASGVTAPSAGAVKLAERDLAGASVESVVAAGVGYVPAGRRVFAGLSVRDNLRLGAWREPTADLTPALDLFPALRGCLDTQAGLVSLARQQMCVIARAVLGGPSYLLIDEPSQGLGPLVAGEILSRIREVATIGPGVLLAEQDLDGALAIADRAYVMENGRVTLAGPAAELAADARVRAAYLGGH